MGLKDTLAAVLPGLRGGADRLTAEDRRIRAAIAAALERKESHFRKGPTREELETAIRREVLTVREKFLVAAAGAAAGAFTPQVIADPSLRGGAREVPAMGWSVFCQTLAIHDSNSPLAWLMSLDPLGIVALLMEAADRAANYGGPMQGRLKQIAKIDAEVAGLREEHRELVLIAREHHITLEPLPQTGEALRARAAAEWAREEAQRFRHANSHGIRRDPGVAAHANALEAKAAQAADKASEEV